MLLKLSPEAYKSLDPFWGSHLCGVIYKNNIYDLHTARNKFAYVTPAVSVNVCSYIVWINKANNEKINV